MYVLFKNVLNILLYFIYILYYKLRGYYTHICRIRFTNALYNNILQSEYTIYTIILNNLDNLNLKVRLFYYFKMLITYLKTSKKFHVRS